MSVQTTRSDGIGLSKRSRYDLLLMLLPLPLLLGGVASLLTAVPEHVGVGLGSLPSAALFVYAITAAAPTTIERSA